MTNSLMLIDGNSLGNAANAADEMSIDGFGNTQAIYTFLSSLRKLKRTLQPKKTIVAWDAGVSWRKEVYPNYKISRAVKKEKNNDFYESYQKQRPVIQEFLTSLGVAQVHSTNYEADDIAGLFARKFKGSKNQCVLVTADQDWYQLITDNVFAYNHKTDLLLNLENFEANFQLSSPSQIVEMKCLEGDSSDDIKGVTGIGAKTAIKLLKEHGSVDNFVSKVKSGEIPMKKVSKAMRRLFESMDVECEYDVIDRNRKLRDLSLSPIFNEKNPVSIKKLDANPTAFKMLCEEYKFNSIRMELNRWIKDLGESND